jgi:hypothetical protein
LIDMLQLFEEVGRERQIAVTNQDNLAPKLVIGGPQSHELAFLSARVTTERVSLGNQSLDCLRRGEGQTFDVLVRV